MQGERIWALFPVRCHVVTLQLVAFFGDIQDAISICNSNTSFKCPIRPARFRLKLIFYRLLTSFRTWFVIALTAWSCKKPFTLYVTQDALKLLNIIIASRHVTQSRPRKKRANSRARFLFSGEIFLSSFVNYLCTIPVFLVAFIFRFPFINCVSSSPFHILLLRRWFLHPTYVCTISVLSIALLTFIDILRTHNKSA